MKNIPHVRATSLAPYIDFCQGPGAPLEFLPLPPVLVRGGKPIRVQDAAALADMSPGTLQRRLASCGMSPSEFRRQLS